MTREALRILRKERENLVKDGVRGHEAAMAFAWIDAQIAFYKARRPLDPPQPPAA